MPSRALTAQLRQRTVALLLVAVALTLQGCGYRIAGRGGAVASKAVWLAPVDDESDEILFGATLAKALSREVVDGADAVLVGRETADLLLFIRVDSVTAKGVAFVVGDRVREYVLVGNVTATLEDAQGNLLWKGVGIRADREYAAGDTVNQTEANKDDALVLLARDLAREVLRRATLQLASGGA